MDLHYYEPGDPRSKAAAEKAAAGQQEKPRYGVPAIRAALRWCWWGEQMKKLIDRHYSR